jgi:hypothetical protein
MSPRWNTWIEPSINTVQTNTCDQSTNSSATRIASQYNCFQIIQWNNKSQGPTSNSTCVKRLNRHWKIHSQIKQLGTIQDSTLCASPYHHQPRFHSTAIWHDTVKPVPSFGMALAKHIFGSKSGANQSNRSNFCSLLCIGSLTIMKLLEVRSIMVTYKLTNCQKRRSWCYAQIHFECYWRSPVASRLTPHGTNVVEEMTQSLASVRQTHSKSCFVTILC